MIPKHPWQRSEAEWNKLREQAHGYSLQSRGTRTSKAEAIARYELVEWLLGGVHDAAKHELQMATDGKIEITPDRAMELVDRINTPVFYRDVAALADEPRIP